MERAELKNLVLIGLLIVVVAYVGWNGFAAIGWQGVAAMRAEAEKTAAERAKLQNSVNNAKLQVANLDKIRKEREALEVQLKEITRRLPGERESAEILRNVESLAGRSGLTLAGVRRRAPRSQELYAELPMEVGVGGGYHELVRFADQLSQLDRLVTLNEFQVTRPVVATGQPAGAAAATPGTVRAQMVAVVFQALPEPTPTLTGAGAPAAGGAATPAR
jgi:Tfp pilus assembly protein PilO